MASLSPAALVPLEGSQDAFRPGSFRTASKAPSAGAPSCSSAAANTDKGSGKGAVRFDADAEDEAGPEPSAVAPAIKVDTERLICGANVAAVLLVLAALLLGLSAFLPWWIWVGREDDDFWGLQPGVKSTFSPVEACQGPRDPEGSTCLTTGSISTFLLVAAACSVGGSVVFELVAFKLQWIFLMLTAAVVAATGTAFGVLAVYLGIQLQITGLRGEGLYLGFTGICFSAAAAALGIWTANKATPPAGTLGSTIEIKESRITRSRAVHEAAELLRESLDRRQKERTRQHQLENPEGEIVRGMTPKESRRPRVPRYQPQNKKIATLEEGRRLKKKKAKPKRPHLQYVIDNSMGGDGRVISVKILEAAFQEIDEDYSGSLTLDELATALRDCGLTPSEEAMDRIVREIDKDCDGTIDINEFVGFFQMAQELYDFQQRRDSRAKVLHAVVQFIFAANVAAVAVLITSQSRQDDTESVGYKRIQGILNMLMISFVVLFVLVVILPLFRLSLGPSVLAWLDVGLFHVKRRYRRWKERRQEAARKKKELEELARMADDFEAGNLSETGSFPGQDFNRTANSAFTAGGMSGSPGPRWAAISDKASSPHREAQKLERSMSESSSGSWYSTEESSEEDFPFEQPGYYLILHDGTSVRSGISNTSLKLDVLRRGQKVRVVEIFEYSRQQRVRGRLFSATGKGERRWITLRDTSDNYCWAKFVKPLQPENRSGQAKLKRTMTQQSRMSRHSRASGGSGMAKKKVAALADDPNTHPGYHPMNYERADKRLWTLCYEDTFVQVYCQRSRWSTKDRLVIEVFAERMHDELFVAEEDDDGACPRSQVFNLKLELPGAAGVQVLDSDTPQNDERENILWLCLGELREATAPITLWLWPHPMVDQSWLTPATGDLPGCCILYDLGLPDRQDEEIYVKAHLKWDRWKQLRHFNGPMQVPDPQRHLSIGDVAPDDKEVRGGMAASRGEWRLGLADK